MTTAFNATGAAPVRGGGRPPLLLFSGTSPTTFPKQGVDFLKDADGAAESGGVLALFLGALGASLPFLCESDPKVDCLNLILGSALSLPAANAITCLASSLLLLRDTFHKLDVLLQKVTGGVPTIIARRLIRIPNSTHTHKKKTQTTKTEM